MACQNFLLHICASSATSSPSNSRSLYPLAAGFSNPRPRSASAPGSRAHRHAANFLARGGARII
eukprot:11196453-Lingulodinium_polyedra.AAC.1